MRVVFRRVHAAPPCLRRAADDPTAPSLTLRSPGLGKNVIAVGAGYKTTSDTMGDDLLVVAGQAARGREIFSFPVGCACMKSKGWWK